MSNKMDNQQEPERRIGYSSILEQLNKGFDQLNRIEERLRGTETQLARLTATRDSENGNMTRLIIDNRRDIDAVINILGGGNEPEKGITHRLISVEEDRQRNKNHLFAIWIIISGVIIKLLGDWLSKMIK